MQHKPHDVVSRCHTHSAYLYSVHTVPEERPVLAGSAEAESASLESAGLGGVETVVLGATCSPPNGQIVIRPTRPQRHLGT